METFHAIALFSGGYLVGFLAGTIMVIEIHRRKQHY